MHDIGHFWMHSNDRHFGGRPFKYSDFWNYIRNWSGFILGRLSNGFEKGHGKWKPYIHNIILFNNTYLNSINPIYQLQSDQQFHFNKSNINKHIPAHTFHMLICTSVYIFNSQPEIYRFGCVIHIAVRSGTICSTSFRIFDLLRNTVSFNVLRIPIDNSCNDNAEQNRPCKKLIALKAIERYISTVNTLN